MLMKPEQATSSKQQPFPIMRLGFLIGGFTSVAASCFVGIRANLYLHPVTTQPISYNVRRVPLRYFRIGPVPDMTMRTLVVYKNPRTGKSYGSPWLEHTRPYCFGFVCVEAKYLEYRPNPLP